MKPREGCVHGEVETDVVRGRITCRLCGTSATLIRYPKVKNHKHTIRLFAGNGKAFYWCTECGWEKPYQ